MFEGRTRSGQLKRVVLLYGATACAGDLTWAWGVGVGGWLSSSRLSTRSSSSSSCKKNKRKGAVMLVY